MDAIRRHCHQSPAGMHGHQPAGAAGASACDGLLDVILGRADMFVAPPIHLMPHVAMPTSVVLCASELLLGESGGYLSHLDGGSIDLTELLALVAPVKNVARSDTDRRSKAEQRGVFACEDLMSNYLIRATRASFPSKDRAMFIDISGLASKIEGSPAVRFADDVP